MKKSMIKVYEALENLPDYPSVREIMEKVGKLNSVLVASLST